VRGAKSITREKKCVRISDSSPKKPTQTSGWESQALVAFGHQRKKLRKTKSEKTSAIFYSRDTGSC
jgi:hypothetical protein